KQHPMDTQRQTLLTTNEQIKTVEEKLLTTGLTGKSSHPTTSKASESSDDEDFNIIEVEADDVHSPDSAVTHTIPFSPPKKSPPAGCNNKKPPVTTTKLNPSESIQDFFTKILIISGIHK
ncbi:hypothetical protein J6590_062495, partial [Homalodisca vitripennis]